MRNYSYDKGWIKSVGFNIPVIAVGNLNMGGTGKTPMIEYLVRLLYDEWDLAVLSRGYGRGTKGFLLAKQGVNAAMIGDEPYQYFRKFEKIQVAVDEDRARGISNLAEQKRAPDVVLLDDAFQHRRVRAGMYILLTSFGKLYSEDHVLPMGDLREPRSGADRADIVVVSKCPDELNEEARASIVKRLRIKNEQEVFFTGIDYSDTVRNESGNISIEELVSYGVVLVTGVANPNPLIEYLRGNGIEFEHLKFADHHRLTQTEKDRIEFALNGLSNEKRIVLTTEKDFVRSFESSDLPVYYLPHTGQVSRQ